MRRWVTGGPALAAGLAAGLAAAGMLAVPDSRRLELYLAGPLWLAVLLVGLLGSAGLAAAAAARRAVARAASRSADAATRAAGDNHRRFLHRLDHELKNPLTVMRLALAAGTDPAGTAPPGALPPDAVDRLRLQADRIGALLADLRKLSELEARPLERSAVDMDELLAEVEAAARELPGMAQRGLTRSVPAAPWPLPPVPGDRDLLFVALVNLAANAAKFTRAGDKIEIRGYEAEHAVVVEVADTGVGIPPAEVGHVWEELARGSAARAVPGTGLGLPLVRAIVARHGGTSVLRSRPGEGTVVTLRLPTR